MNNTDPNMNKFPTLLKLYKYEIERLARRMGLSFRDIIYEMVDFEEMSEVVAHHGFPVMVNHWRYGQESIQNKQMFKHTHSRTFEIVVNTNPVYAFLMDTNEYHDQKAVMAHVCGHAHLFSNNLHSQFSNKNMDQVFASDAVMMKRFCDEFGKEKVKRWYDWVLSLEPLIDPESLYFKRPPLTISPEEREKMRNKRKKLHRLESREDLPPYMDEFLNPPEWIEEQKARLDEEEVREREVERGTKVPPHPMRDLLFFLTQYAPLEGWQRAVIEMVRRQAYYFSQFRTKFSHEGWASLWEEEVMFALGHTQDKDMTRWIATLAQVQRPGPFNPYKLGYDLYRDIEYRWNTGRHGTIWNQCDMYIIKEQWDDFIVFHNLRLESNGDESRLRQRWNEFIAFTRALNEGRLGYPAELFVGRRFTKQLFLPTWVQYNKCQQEYTVLKDRLARMDALGLEEQIPEEVQKLREEIQDAGITDAELAYKARRDLYIAAGQEELYLWTRSELMRAVSGLESLCVFQKEMQAAPCNDAVDVPDEWHQYSSRFSEPMEIGIGRRKMFEVCATCDDYNIIDEFFTKDFCETNKYFLAKAKTVWPDWYNAEEHYILESRAFERIKQKLLFQFTNYSRPVIRVVDANYRNNGDLYLVHDHTGVDLDTISKDQMYIKDVLQRLFYIWGGKKRVYLETILTQKEEERPWWFSWHGNKQKEGGEVQNLKGLRVLFSYGLKRVDKKGSRLSDAEMEEEYRDAIVLGEVDFPSPF